MATNLEQSLPPMIGQLEDLPITEARTDLLDFCPLAELLAARIASTQEKAADVFGLYGPWGSGKSSCLALLKTCLPEDVAWLDFDALKYQANEGVLLPLIHRLALECGTGEARQFFSGMTKAIGNFLVDVVVATSPYKHEVDKLVEAIKGIPDSLPQGKNSLPESRSVVIENTFDQLVKLLLKLRNKRRLVVAIDNLDRCAPSATLELIEAIHLLLTTESTTFILAMDHGACITFVSKEYGHSASEASLYLEKMIPDYFRVPVPWIAETHDEKNPDAIFSFLRGILNNAQCVHLRAHAEMLWAITGSTTMLRNPRRIKRLVRRLSLFDEEFWIDHSALVEAVVFVVVLSDIWPALLQQFPLMWPKDWENLIATAAPGNDSQAGPRAFADKAFDELVVSVTQWRGENNSIDTMEINRTRIGEYDVIDKLLAELQAFGI